jgi:hypothetical protein
VAKSGGTPTPLTTELSAPREIVLAAGRAYVIDQEQKVMSVPVDGGTPVVVAEATGAREVFTDLSVDGSDLYFASTTDNVDMGGTIYRVPLAGGSPIPVTTVAPPSAPVGIALDVSGVYFTTTGEATVMSVAKGGGSPSTLATDLTDPLSIRVRNQTVIWTELTRGLFTLPTSGGTSPTQLSVVGGAASLAVDDVHAYFTSVLFSSLHRVPLAGGQTVDLLRMVVQPGGVVVDDTSVYVAANGTTGAVLKVPK